MFEEMGKTLNKALAGTNTLVLIFSSLTMALAVDAAQKRNQKRLVVCLLATFLCACGFMVIKAFEYANKFGHYTMVVNEDGQRVLYDGHLHTGEHGHLKMEHAIRLPLDDETPFNLHFASPGWMEEEMHRRGLVGSNEKIEEKTYDIHGTVVQKDEASTWNGSPCR